ncbi:hypothetical protein [Nesterenkonia sp. NBAIMH1]|uniref:hypothetical protein n=1 Tax=Nesterenkonia sp. NBAIMH1 TaxID=2600320 RepID=UPI0011B85CC2|nr:hypothetical protein [Nesterenkonia sp. NBAIMH1]
MTRGLSTKQIAVIGAYGIALLATLIAVLAGAWTVAAAAGIISLGLLSVLLVFTLAAMTRIASLTRQQVREIHHQTRAGEELGQLRRLEADTAERFKELSGTLQGTEARIEAAERRLLATFEAHRDHLEEDIAALRKHLAGER